MGNRLDRDTSDTQIGEALDAISAMPAIPVTPSRAPASPSVPPPLSPLGLPAAVQVVSPITVCQRCGHPAATSDQTTPDQPQCPHCGAPRVLALEYAPPPLRQSRWVWTLFFRNFFIVVGIGALVVGYLARLGETQNFPLGVAAAVTAFVVAFLAHRDSKAIGFQWVWICFLRNLFIAIGVGIASCGMVEALGFASWDVSLWLFARASFVSFLLAVGAQVFHRFLFRERQG